jgi:hypothetical protein
MKIENLEITRLELKYCERCGALWLRQRDTGRVYCAVCTSEVPRFPLCGRRVSRPHLRNTKLEMESLAESTRSLTWGGGGNA